MILLQAYAYETRPNSLSFVQRHNGHLGSPQSRASAGRAQPEFSVESRANLVGCVSRPQWPERPIPLAGRSVPGSQLRRA